MKELCIILIVAITMLMLFAFEAERQRKARHRAATRRLCSYISSYHLGLVFNEKWVNWR